jgi:hypothetical protein
MPEKKKEEFPGCMVKHASWELLPQICVVSGSEYGVALHFLQGYVGSAALSNKKAR